MKGHSLILLRVLANRFHPGQVPAFCQPLAEDTAQAVLETDIDGGDTAFVWSSVASWLDRIHYSWLIPAVTSFPAVLQPSVLAILRPAQAAGLSQVLSLTAAAELPTRPAAQFLQQRLYAQLQLDEVLPLEIVPPGPFDNLCTWNKAHLVSLIDYLSMYDLKEKIRQIVDRKRLHDIYACLEKNRLEFLRHCLHQKERLSSTELRLENWRGDKAELENLLHRRGLIRLGTALSGQHPAFMWHLTHILDTGRSAAIMRCVQSPAPAHVVELLAQQVKTVIEYMDMKKHRE